VENLPEVSIHLLRSADLSAGKKVKTYPLFNTPRKKKKKKKKYKCKYGRNKISLRQFATICDV
jgi:hypothetical protein